MLFNADPPDPQLQVSVVVPIRNEAEQLPVTLDALRLQQYLDGQPFPSHQYEVLLLLNNCTDTSETIARTYRQQHPEFRLRIAHVQLPPEKANVGTARRLLMEESCERLFRVNRPHGIIASTDGDTVVDRQWLAQIQAELQRGCDVVGGRILTRRDDSPVRLNHLRNVTYRMLIAHLEALLDPLPHDPWPRHFQHFGASLAITAEAYVHAGGLPDVAHLEDEALYQTLLRTDVRIRQSPYVRVTTSARLHGRVEVGFSEQLRHWDKLNQSEMGQMVESAEWVIQRIQHRRQARLFWQNPSDVFLRKLAMQLGINADWLCRQARDNAYFGQFWSAIDQRLSQQTGPVTCPLSPIAQAITDLRTYLRSLD